MTPSSLSSVETPVDGRRIVSSVMVSLIGFVSASAPSSSHSSMDSSYMDISF